MDVCPSILEYKDEDYIVTIKKLTPYYQYFQIDFADGTYVDNKTSSLDGFIKIAKETNSQIFAGIVFDFHLMIKDYEEYLKKLEELKKIITIKNVFIHFDLHPEYVVLDTKYSFSIGLVISPYDQIDDLGLRYNLNIIPAIQIMSIIPGAQGKPFMPETLNKIEQLRKLGYRNKIYLDGAVNEKTLPIINSQKYKPDYVCPGSYLAKSPDGELKKRVDYLLSFK